MWCRWLPDHHKCFPLSFLLALWFPPLLFPLDFWRVVDSSAIEGVIFGSGTIFCHLEWKKKSSKRKWTCFSIAEESTSVEIYMYHDVFSVDNILIFKWYNECPTKLVRFTMGWNGSLKANCSDSLCVGMGPWKPTSPRSVLYHNPWLPGRRSCRRHPRSTHRRTLPLSR